MESHDYEVMTKDFSVGGLKSPFIFFSCGDSFRGDFSGVCDEKMHFLKISYFWGGAEKGSFNDCTNSSLIRFD